MNTQEQQANSVEQTPDLGEAFSQFGDADNEQQQVSAEVEGADFVDDDEGAGAPEGAADATDADDWEYEKDGKKWRLPKEAEGWRKSHDDFTYKAQQVAEQRKIAEVVAQQAAQERSYYQQHLGGVITQLQMQADPFSRVNWQQLSVENPTEYVRLRAAAEQNQQQLQQAVALQQQLGQQQQAAESARQTEYLREQHEMLREKLPDWRNSDKRAAEQTAIAKMLAETGYSTDEIGGLVDHRALLIARDAMLYRRMMAQRGAAQSQPKGSNAQPGKTPTMRAAVNQTGDAHSTQIRKGIQELKRTGDKSLAQALFAEL